MTGLSLVFILISFSILYVLQLMFRHFFWKLLVITYLFLISSGIYFSFDSYKGWPSKDPIEDGMLVMSMTVEPSDQHKGAIYLWVIPTEKEMNFFEKFLTYNFGMIAPRSCYIPYSKKAASEFAEANEKIKKGYIVMVEGEGSEDQVEGEGGQQRQGGGSQQSNGEQENYDVPSLEIISPDTLMRKAPQ